MRIAFITAGAAGMYCGSCMRDNTLVGALNKIGHDALLIPTYTPIRTDEDDSSQKRVFFGGINVFLQQKSWLFRKTPWLLDRLLDYPRLLKWVSRFAVRTPYSVLGALTVSMLKGEDGFQKKELAKLVAYLRDDVKPDVILLTNALLSGILPALKVALSVPVLVTLQGDDIFLDALPEKDRGACVDLIRENLMFATATISTSRFYADHMNEYLGIHDVPSHVVYPGINLKGHGEQGRVLPTGGPYRVGYFARIAPEKGFHNLVDAFIHLRQTPGTPKVLLKASGWLGENNRGYFEQQVKKLAAAGLTDDFEHVESKDHAAKVRFLQSVDVLSVPTTYREPKGLYVLEAWANGLPVVQPAHGSFPELIEMTGAGHLVPPNDPAALAAALVTTLTDAELHQKMSRLGLDRVRDRFTAERMAKETVAVLEKYT
ncbi:glycosyltransferase family 4 protein [Limnoglobus roseus]|uniref:GT4 family glycosyltransferase n=1 Tax=Limnoglobus roseus TaxID=2598579 RepID=A0A5C1AEF1_9BACT|nr:glycosyltransferase family 4 protein [Limnoglobus roseus]QEL16965.1 GT4 family glycosyltransferase [Limnoglobus roseus]